MRLFKSQSGTSFIEFALIAPILALMAVGVIDVGRWTYYGIVAASASRAGAQYGSQDVNHADDNSGITNAVNTENAQGVTWTTINVSQLCSVNGGALTSCVSNGSGAPQNTIYYVKVQVSGTFSPLIQYPGFNSLPVSGSSVMRLVNQ